MELNEDKFDLMVHRAYTNYMIDNLPFTVNCYTYTVSNGDILYPSVDLKDLGVFVSPSLSWSPHINNIHRVHDQLHTGF